AVVGEGGDEVGMARAKPGHGDTTGEIEKAPAVGGEQIGPLPPLKGKVGARIGRQQGADHALLPLQRALLGRGDKSKTPGTGVSSDRGGRRGSARLLGRDPSLVNPTRPTPRPQAWSL